MRTSLIRLSHALQMELLSSLEMLQENLNSVVMRSSMPWVYGGNPWEKSTVNRAGNILSGEQSGPLDSDPTSINSRTISTASPANQAETLRDPELRRVTRRRVASLKAQIARLDKRIAEFVEASPSLREKASILLSIPDVGMVLCVSLLAYLPELGKLSRHQVAALVGVAPMDSRPAAFAF